MEKKAEVGSLTSSTNSPVRWTSCVRRSFVTLPLAYKMARRPSSAGLLCGHDGSCREALNTDSHTCGHVVLDMYLLPFLIGNGLKCPGPGLVSLWPEDRWGEGE